MLLIAVQPLEAQGPRLEHRFPASSARPTLQQKPASIPGMAAGGLVAGALGFVAFGLAGAVFNESKTQASDPLVAWSGFVVGAAVGTTVMLPLGVHLVNRRQGNYGLELLAAIGIAAVGIGATAAAEEMAIVFLPAIPVAQLVTAIAIERSASP